MMKKRKQRRRPMSMNWFNFNMLNRPIKPVNSIWNQTPFRASTFNKVTSAWNKTPSRPMAYWWGDWDNDGIYNGVDCAPRNRFRQGPQHKKPRFERNIANENKLLRVMNKDQFDNWLEHGDPNAEVSPAVKRIERLAIGGKIGKLARPVEYPGYNFRIVKGKESGSRPEKIESIRYKADLARAEKQFRKMEAIDLVEQKFGTKEENRMELNPEHLEEFYNKKIQNLINRKKKEESQYARGLNRMRNLNIEDEKKWKGRFGDDALEMHGTMKKELIRVGKTIESDDKDQEIKISATKEGINKIENEIDEAIEVQEDKKREEDTNRKLLEKLHGKISEKLGSDKEDEIFDDLGDFEVDENK